MGDPLGWEALKQQEAEHDALARIDWYRRCLEDVQDGVVVRGLAEAKAGYDSAIDEVGRLGAALAVAVRERDQARDALRRIAEGSTVIDYDTPSLAREIARAALAVGENATEGET